MTINLSLIILQMTRILKQSPLSVFVVIDSLVVLDSLGGYAISRQNNLELHLSWHICWLSYFTSVCLWCGRMVGRLGRCTVTWLENLLGWVDLLSHGAPHGALRACVVLRYNYCYFARSCRNNLGKVNKRVITRVQREFISIKRL